jgi:hypothetical protein
LVQQSSPGGNETNRAPKQKKEPMVRAMCMLVSAAMLCTAVANAQRLLPDDQSKRIIDAIEKNDTKALLQFYPHKEDLDARLSSGDTSLSVAAAVGQKAVVDLLIERGADANAVSGHGWTALMVAIFYGNHDIAKTLLDHHAKTDVRGEDGATPRSLAVWRGDTELAALMPPEVPSHPVADDLVAAVSAGGGEMVDRLLTAGVSPTTADDKGTPVLVITASTNTTVPLRTSIKPSGSTHGISDPSKVGVMPIPRRANMTVPSRTMTKPSGLTRSRICFSCSGARPIPTRANMTVPLRTSTKPSDSIR